MCCGDSEKCLKKSIFSLLQQKNQKNDEKKLKASVIFEKPEKIVEKKKKAFFEIRQKSAGFV